MIPLSVPHLKGNELKYIEDCISTGWVSSAGKYVSLFEEELAKYSGNKYGVATVNGTSALHLAMHVLGIAEGDSVIVPNLTFVASANAVSYTNAKPIFIDIDPETWQLDLDLLDAFLSKHAHEHNIKAIMPVHVLGNICDMSRLSKLADEYGIGVIEDATESLGSFRNGKHSGSWGIMGVFSFNGNKIITTGGGGLIVSNHEAHAKRAKHLSTQAKLDPEKYFHDEIGFNYRMVNVLAAIGLAQMEQLPEILIKKKQIDSYYRMALLNVGDIRFQKIEEEVNHNAWLFTFYSKRKTQILEALKLHEIVARPFWTPMNQLPMFENNIYFSKHNYSKDIHENCISIPSSASLTKEEMKNVVAVIKSCFT